MTEATADGTLDKGLTDQPDVCGSRCDSSEGVVVRNIATSSYLVSIPDQYQNNTRCTAARL